MIELHLLHPAAVHFPIALLTVGLAVAARAHLRERPEWLSRAGDWLLWLGTLSAWATLGLGLLAEEYGPHVPSAWETMGEHEALGWWTVGLFTALSVWRALQGRKWERVFLVLWLAAAGVLLSTAYHGGELVFKHGVGVAVFGQ